MARANHIFVSYARPDRSAVEQLTHALQRLRNDVWVDEELSGGQSWWNVILEQIRNCHVFVACVSPAMINSAACQLESEYASRLQKSILPIAVAPVPLELLPRNLAHLQVVQFAANNVDSAFDLAAALNGLPPPAPTPHPFPPPPPVPISYLTELGEQIRAPRLDVDAQLALVARLEHAAGRGNEAAAVTQLAQQLLSRDDLYYSAARSLQRLLDSTAAAPSLGATVSGSRSSPPDAHPQPPSATMQAKTSSLGTHGSSQPDVWSARIVEVDAKNRTFELRRGPDSWIVRLEARWSGTTIYVNGENKKHKTKGWNPPIRLLFAIDVNSEEQVACEFRYSGGPKIAGLVFFVQGRTVLRDGVLAD